MTIQTAIVAAPETADTGHSMYLREREYSKRLERQLSAACVMLEGYISRLERDGEDSSHIRQFVREARS